jgi:hypothetical protein
MQINIPVKEIMRNENGAAEWLISVSYGFTRNLGLSSDFKGNF